jgi:holo-[acyl-carrier protein] synthase
MIFGTGIDAIEVERIAQSIETYGDRFLRRIYSEEEIAYCNWRYHSNEHFAARFAAKEAFSKALGTGWRRGFIWKEVSIRNERSGRPVMYLYPTMQERAKKLIGPEFRIHVSLTHTKAMAEATCLIETL